MWGWLQRSGLGNATARLECGRRAEAPRKDCARCGAGLAPYRRAYCAPCSEARRMECQADYNRRRYRERHPVPPAAPDS